MAGCTKTDETDNFPLNVLLMAVANLLNIPSSMKDVQFFGIGFYP